MEKIAETDITENILLEGKTEVEEKKPIEEQKTAENIEEVKPDEEEPKAESAE